MTLLFLIFMLVFLGGCSGPLAATPPPTPQAVDVAVTPALRPLAKALHACAQAHPEMAMFLEETPAPSPGPNGLAFRLGEPPAGAAFAAPVGQDQIVVILNETNPLSRLSSQALGDLFRGRIASWDELGGLSQAVQAWIYPEGDEIRQVFSSAVIPQKEIDSQALLAPDPAAMLEAVSADPGAIGFLPRAWLAAGVEKPQVKIAQLEPELAAALRQPVLASSSSRPQGAAYILLSCLQGETGRKAMEGIYEP